MHQRQKHYPYKAISMSLPVQFIHQPEESFLQRDQDRTASVKPPAICWAYFMEVVKITSNLEDLVWETQISNINSCSCSLWHKLVFPNSSVSIFQYAFHNSSPEIFDSAFRWYRHCTHLNEQIARTWSQNAPHIIWKTLLS